MANEPVTVRWQGFEGIRAVLQKLPEETQKKVMGVALKRAAAPLVRTAKMLAPKKSGALRASITSLVKRGRNGSSYAVVGPARGRYIGGKKLSMKASAEGADMPAKYAHLVEFGHHAVSPRKGTSRRKGTASLVRFVAAKPFLRPALLTSQGEVFSELGEGVKTGIEQAIARIAKNPGAKG